MPLVRLLALCAFAGAVFGSTLTDQSAPGRAFVCVIVAIACAIPWLPAGLRARRQSLASRRRWFALVCVTGYAVLGAADSSDAPPEWSTPGESRLVALFGVVDGPVDGPLDATPGDEGDGLEVRLVLRETGPEVRAPPRWAVSIDHAERGPELAPGDALRVVGWAQAIRGPTNPGQHDAREGLARRGIVGFLRVRSGDAVTLLPQGAANPARVRRIAESLRATITGRIDAALGAAPGPDTPGARRAAGTAALARCLLVGDRSALDEDVADAFRAAGLAHLLAVSGLHVVLLTGIALAAVSLVRLRRPGSSGQGALGPVALGPGGTASFVVLIAGLVCYAAVCRFATPVVRAATFLALAGLARLVGRRIRTLDLVAAAALSVLIHDPSQAVETGFLLSFTAVIGLAVFTPRLRQALFPSLALLEAFPDAIPHWKFVLRRRCATAIAASLAAWTATAPLIAGRFGVLHPAGIAANVVAVPLTGPALACAATAACSGAALPVPLRAICRAVLYALESVARGTASLPIASWKTPGVADWAMFAAGLVLLCGARRRHWGRRDLAFPLTAVALLAAASLGAAPASRREQAAERSTARPPAEVIVLDVGHGLAVLLRAADGTDVLVDAGGLGRDVAERRILPALRALGVTELAALIVSHEDFDHCGDAADVVAAIPTRELIVAHGFGSRAPADRLLRLCTRQGVPVTRAARGARFRRGGVELRVLHPAAGTPGPIGNEESLVVHAVCLGAPDLSVLLPGDVQKDALDALARDRTLPAAEVLLLPHHGHADGGLLAALARRCGARVQIASGAARGPRTRPEVQDASDAEAGDGGPFTSGGRGLFTTGRDGAVRVRPGRAAEHWPFPVESR